MITLWAPQTRGKESLRDEISYANVQSCCLINPQWPNLAQWHISDGSTLLTVTNCWLFTGWRRSVRPLSSANRHLRPNAEVQRYSFRFGTEMEDRPRLRMEYRTTLKWAWPGSRAPISKFRDPNNFLPKRAIRFKFGTDIEDGASLRRDHKTTPKWAWPGSCDLIS